MRKIFRIKQS